MTKSMLTTISTKMKKSTTQSNNNQHPTASFARRVLFLLTFLMTCAGNVWGQTFNASGKMVDDAVVVDKYLDILNLSDQKEITIALEDIIEALNSFGAIWTTSNIADNVYIRWSVLDSEGDFAEKYKKGEVYYGEDKFGLYCSAEDLKWEDRIAGFYWFKELEPWTNPHNLDSKLSVTIYVDKNTKKTYADYADYTVVCYITDEYLDNVTPGSNSYTAGSLNNEPSFKVKYVFHFGAKVDDFANEPNPAGHTTGAKSKEIETDEPQPVDLNEAFAKTPGVDYKYVRIFLENNGKVVDPDGKLTVSYQGKPLELNADFKERGYYQYQDGVTLQASDFEVTLNVPEGEFENYQVVCVFAKDVDDNWDEKEPEWDLQYTYSFEYPFKGKVTDETVKMETTFEVPGSMQIGQFNVGLDYDSKLAKLDYYTSQWTQNTISSVSIDANFFTAFSNKTLGSEDKFYVRWFLRRDGEEVYVPNVIVDAGDGIYSSPVKGRYYYWSTSKHDGKNDLSKILKIKLDASVLPSKLTDYELVFTVATDLEGETYDSGNLTHEPNTMAYEYTFCFIDKPFEAENIETVKTINKTILFNNSDDVIKLDLFTNNRANTLADLSTDITNLVKNGYLRWYVTTTDGDMVDITSDNSEWKFNAELNYISNAAYGCYIEPSSDLLINCDEWGNGCELLESDVYKLDPTFKFDKNKYKQYQIVCVISKNKSSGSLYDYEPTMDIKYVFNLMSREEYEARPFVHYKGHSGRDWVTPEGSKGGMSQLYWDDVVAETKQTSEDIRQGVHTVQYDVYVANEEVELLLPFEGYGGGGNTLEPTAYIRWYDYTTDLNSSRLSPSGGNSTKLVEYKEKLDNNATRDRGWMFLNTSKTDVSTAVSSAIGVKFNGSGLGENESVTIACDVSKYYDGIVLGPEDDLLLVHEPTLSVRYIFNIHRAEDGAKKIDKQASVFEQALSDMKNGKAYSEVKKEVDDIFDLFENNGRTVVSLNGKVGEFSLRASLPNLGYYYISNAGTPVKCENIDWYAYYENEKGLYYKGLYNDEEGPVSSGNGGTRIFDATFDKLTGKYYLLSDKTQSVDVQSIDGARIHIVGYLKSGNARAAAIHYELSFIDAPALPITTLVKAKETDPEFKRTKDYLNEKLTFAAEVNFDDLFKNADGTTNYSRPSTWEENILQMPLEWDEAEYSFCYPGIDAYRQNNAWTGINPQHGDYMLLKSMNLPGVSEDKGSERRWYYTENYQNQEIPILLDYTYTYSDGKDYGGFFYVDASDEARTVANLSFNASLCSGSEIHFTMAVADVTVKGKTAPQLIAHVYEMTDDGKKGRLVISFIACTLNSGIIKASGSESESVTWYQYYGYGTIPASLGLNGVNKNYIVEIDNNSKNTDGADFCVDEIRFYTNTTKLRVTQGVYDCDEEESKTNLYIKAEDIQSYMTVSGNTSGKTIFWRICDRDHNPIPENEDHTIYRNGSDETGWKNYGQIVIPGTTPNLGDIDTEEKFNESEKTFGFFKDKDNVIYFSLAHWVFGLDEGSRYYVALYELEETTDTPSEESYWGRNDNACDVYSQIFMPRKMYVTVTNGEGKDNSEVTIGCGETSSTVDINVVLHVPDNTQASGFKSYTDFKFDFFLGTLEEYKNIEGLYDAMVSFRNQNHNEYTSYENLPTECKENGEWPVIGEAVKAGKLYLLHSEKIGDLDISTNNKTILAIPTQGYVMVTDKNGNPRKNEDGSEMQVEICDPFEFTFEILQGDGNGPSLILGFKEVTTYPDALRVVRVGKKQLREMQNDYILHVPVHSFTTGKTDETGTDDDALIIEGALELLSYKNGDNQTNDQDVSSNSRVVATFVGNEINRTNKQYIALKFHGTYKDDNGTTQNVDKYDFKEGFTYRMFFVIKAKNADEGSCDGKSEFLLKVVPEFVTWKGSGNQWNNDTNWGRSTRAELHKGKAETEPTDDNHKTDGHPNGYKDNSDLRINGDKAFVPMKFTYVTIPSNNVAPMLKELTIDSEGIYDAISMGSDVTKDIEYDMMVRYTEKNCVTEGHEGYDDKEKNIYDCEKFYGNWAKEIYFKPEAELVNQHYLTYEKVWVEKKLTAGQWTLMSTPLQNTYAGDMYVPFADGQQATEAFQPIEFNTTTYSRTKYPIYQRSWQQEGSKVYTKANDVRATKYNAELKGSVDETLTQWSHTYNDVWVDYSKWKGFAIRAHKSDYSGAPNALLRLPKADDEYDYYDWNDGNGEQPTPPANALSRSNSGKLFTDASAAVNGVTYGVAYGCSQGRTAGDGNVSEVANVVQNADNYVLVGNPYLCSIDMSEFLKENYKENGTGSLATNGYWTYENSTMKAGAAGEVVNPLQAFFVKAKADASEIKFTADMMTDGNSQTNNGSRTFALTAANDRGRSTATVTVGEEARSVETLFDSNLADVPMVYTVADGQAVSINQVTGLGRPIAFGVTCTASDEPVAVTFSDIEQLTSGEVYVVDAVTGEQTLVGEGSALTVQPNDYGRYFLLAGTLGIREQVDVQQGIVVSVRGRVVTVTSGEVLTAVRAVAADGTTVYQTTVGGTTTSFTLATPGVYVVKAENVAGEQQTVKVVVK